MEYDEDQIDEEQTDKELWRSRTSGRKTLILLTSCLALLAVMLAGIYFASKSQNKTLQIVFLIFAAIAIVAGFVIMSQAQWYENQNETGIMPK